LARGLHPVHVGCSGWNYASWRETFYEAGVPERRWLENYAASFDTVEVNATFYRLPTRESVANWVRQTPARFLFAVKASRYLTHVKRLAGIEGGVERFYAPLRPLIDAGRLGVVLWQLPESFHRDDERLAAALSLLPSGRHAIELRHPSWFVEDVYSILREHDATLVIADHPERRFQTCEPTALWRYVRFHHGARGRRGNYSHTELIGWALRLHEWRQREPVFAYFNNDWEAFAPRNALALCAELDRLARA